MESVTIREITNTDFDLILSWLAQPHVFRWWADHPASEVASMRVEWAAGRCEYLVGCVEEQPIGLVQIYPLDSYPEYIEELVAAGVTVPAQAASMDYFIGEPTLISKGIGTKMLRLASAWAWRNPQQYACLMVPVHVDNQRSWRALQAVGFEVSSRKFELAPDNPIDSRTHVICTLTRIE